MKRTKRKEAIHKPVLIQEVVKALNLEKFALLKRQARIIDATVGTGGHTKKIIEYQAFVLGIDADKNILENAREILSKACSAMNQTVRGSAPKRDFRDCFVLAQGNFKDIDKIAKEFRFRSVDGILFDLGISTLHLKSYKRGFSFENSSVKLDMRLDQDTQSVKASDLLNALDKKQLSRLFEEIMGEVASRRLAGSIYTKRKTKPFKTVSDLLAVVNSVKARKKLHPATLAFLALRIATNSELVNLKVALPKALLLLKTGGRLAIISFHSGEDRIVKNFYQESGHKIINKKPVTPSTAEISENPNARSAKLRVLEKI